MPGGRPSKYDPKYCDYLIEHRRMGLTFESFGSIANVSKKTLYTWLDTHEEFLNAKSIGDSHCRLFWEKKSIENLNDKTFNTTTWVFWMKNSFGWHDGKQPQINLSKDDDKLIINIGKKE